MSLTTQINLGVIANLAGAVADFGTTAFPVNYQKGFTWASGVGLNQADMMWSDQRTLGSGANEDIDLAGVLTSHLGGTLTFVRLKMLLVFAAPTNTVNVTVSRPATNGVPFLAAAGDAFVLKPGGLFLFTDPSAAGVVVTPGTGDLINVLAGAASSVYDILVIGGLT